MDINCGGRKISFDNIMYYLDEMKYKAENLEKSFNKIFDHGLHEEDLLEKNGLKKLAINIMKELPEEEFDKTMKEIIRQRADIYYIETVEKVHV